MSPVPASKIYARELYSLGHGLPIWFPDSEAGRGIFPGDVGWLTKRGQLHSLFSTMKREEDDLNKKGVPVDFQMFDVPRLSMGRCFPIMQRTLYSRSIYTVDTQAEISAGR